MVRSSILPEDPESGKNCLSKHGEVVHFTQRSRKRKELSRHGEVVYLSSILPEDPVMFKISSDFVDEFPLESG